MIGTFSSLSKPYVEAWYSIAEWGLLIFGIVLLVALVGELRADKERKITRLSKKELRMLEEFGQPKAAEKDAAFFKKYKTSFALFVVFGVLGEVFSEAGIFEFGRLLQTMSDHENSDLQVSAARMQDEAWRSQMQVEQMSNNIAQANERAAVANRNAIRARVDLVKAEAQLNESVKALQDATSPMDIGELSSFAKCLTPAGIGVELRSSVDANAQHTADSLEGAFFMAGWPVINRRFAGNVEQQGVLIGCNGDNASQNASQLLLKTLLDRGIPAQISIFVRNVPTNSIIVAVLQRPDKTNADLIIASSMYELIAPRRDNVRMQLFVLGYQKFRVPSKEYDDALARYKKLSEQFNELDSEATSWDQKRQNLQEEMGRAEEGTNFDKPGVHLSHVTIMGARNFFGGVTGTNSNVNIHDVSVNPDPLE